MGDAIWTTGVDAQTFPNIFQKNYKPIIAMKRELAVIIGVRLAPLVESTGLGDYYAGTVLANYTSGSSSGLFVDYASSGASGRQTAVAILLHDVATQDTTQAPSSPLAQALFSGYALKANLASNYTSNALTGLGGKEMTGADGITVVKF
jgi:hypothetical protein